MYAINRPSQFKVTKKEPLQKGYYLSVRREIELHKRQRNDRKSLTVADPIQMVHKRNPTMFDGLPADGLRSFDCKSSA